MIKTEADVGDIVIDYLKGMNHEVYCEVDSGYGRIDIVSVCGSVVTAIELKKSLTFHLLGQAIARSWHAHRTIIAFPHPSRYYDKEAALKAINEKYGVGVWLVKDYSNYGHGFRHMSINETIAPKFNRKANVEWTKTALKEEQKNQRAGVNKGQWSPFRDTKERLILYVKRHPGCTIKDAMSEIKHHYTKNSSACSNMGTWIKQGVIKEIERVDGRLYLRN